MNELRPYQKDGVGKLQAHHYGLFWKMRLGKTCVVLLSIPKQPGLSIVVCPISAFQTWIDEVEKWRPDIKIVSTIGLISKYRKIKRAKAFYGSTKYHVILLVNYEQAKETFEWLQKYNIDLQMAVADESSYIKNRAAKRTKAAIKISERAKRRCILSGTPVLQGPLDLYSQMQFLDKGILPESFWTFQSRYAVMGGFENKQATGYKNLSHLTDRIKKWTQSLSVEDVISDLPPRIYTKRIVQLSLEERKSYNTIKDLMLLELPTGKYVPIVNALSKITKLAQAASGFFYTEFPNQKSSRINLRHAVQVGESKRREVVNLLTSGELNGDKTIIWSVLRYELMMLSSDLTKAKLKVASQFVNGSYILAAKKFMSGQADILIANPMALGYGINLGIADTMIFVSNTYKYGDREQAEARADNLEKKTNALIIDIIADKTIDSKILKIIQKKATIAEIILEELGVGTNSLERGK